MTEQELKDYLLKNVKLEASTRTTSLGYGKLLNTITVRVLVDGEIADSVEVDVEDIYGP